MPKRFEQLLNVSSDTSQSVAQKFHSILYPKVSPDSKSLAQSFIQRFRPTLCPKVSHDSSAVALRPRGYATDHGGLFEPCLTV